MRLSAMLKKFLVDNCGAKETATDDEFRAAAGEAFADGSLTAEKYQELVTTKSEAEAGSMLGFFKGFGDSLAAIRKSLEQDSEEDDEEEDDEEEEPATKSKKGGKAATKATKQPRTNLEKMVTRLGMGSANDDDDGDDGEEKSFSVRVKSVVEKYDGTKSAAIYPSTTSKGRAHPLAGQRMTDYNETGFARPLDNSSERDKAVAGAYGQFIVNVAIKKSRTLGFMSMPEESRDLLLWAMDNEKWGGSTDGGQFADIAGRKLTPHEQKALIDDATSGGLEAAPIVFDDQIIQTPLLNGELYPWVNTKPLDRGRRVEGVATGTVTSSWGGVDDTAITLFNTASYVTAFDTTIFRWEGAIRIGLDFLSDTPIDFNAHITEQYGERLLEDLDDVIATGNGTTQPEGIMVKAGTTSINFGGTTTLGNYESLRFGVAKPEHKGSAKASAVFCGTETSYMRARAIPVGSSDARRLGGSQATIGGVTDYSDYSWMGVPYKINESMTNAKVFYAILARYRMYRRRGFTIRTSTEGDTLIRNNEMLMVAMARYGGQLERGAVAAVTSTAPA